MNKHLIFILIFIIIAPIGAINWIGYNLIQSNHKLKFLENEVSESPYLEYQKHELESPDHSQYLVLKVFTFCFFLLGGYFLVSYLRAVGSTVQKVSFINQASHELKTPLTNLRLYIDLLKDSLGDDSSSLKKITVLEQESIRLERLVNNVLLFSYGERLTLNQQKEDIDTLITQIAESFRPLFDQKGIEIQLDCMAGSDYVDRAVLEQVIVNLIGNVGKYAAEGKFINIKARKKDDRVSIIIQDDGPGIPENMKETVFRPFSRGDDRLTEGVSGIGIGLTLCVNLLEAHGGELRLKKSESGTCFEVIF